MAGWLSSPPSDHDPVADRLAAEHQGLACLDPTSSRSRLGLAHAAYGIGCRWALMAVLVAAGAMGLPWVVLIALAIFAEKLLPGGETTTRAIGLGLVVLGVAVAGHPELAAALRGPGM